VFFLGINGGSDNEEVALFDETYGITHPSASGTQGGGDLVHENYEILSYPTVIVITPDHQIVEQGINPPTTENITDAVIAAGGIWVSTPETENTLEEISIYPNPTNNFGYLSLNALERIILSYGIYDMLGKRLFLSETMHIDQGQQRIVMPVNELNNGMYFVKLVINEKTSKTIRFIVSK